MAKMDTTQRNALPDSAFAYIDSAGKRHLPLHDENHVRDALSRVNQTQDSATGKLLSPGEKTAALSKIRGAARKFGIDVNSKAAKERDDEDDATQADEPGVDDVHTPGPIGKPKGKKGPSSLKNLMRAARQHFASGRMMDQPTFERMSRQAIGSTGGKSKGKRAAETMPIGEMEVDDQPLDDAGLRQFSAHFTGANGEELRMLIPLALSEDHPASEWIEYLPKPGTWTSPRYGQIEITAERNRRFIENFNRAIYQNRLPIDSEHETKLAGALGWIEPGGMRLSSNGSVEAYVEWTPRGQKMLAEKRVRYFSPEWYDDWNDPATGNTFSDVAIGGALTTRPFFKPGSLRPIIASEDGIFAVTVRRKPQEETVAGNDENTNEDKNTDLAKQLTEAQETIKALQAQVAAGATIKATDGDEVSRRMTEVEAANKGLSAANEQLVAQVKQASEAVVAMQVANQRREFSELAKGWMGDTTAHVDVLMALPDAPTGDGTGPSLRAQYVTTQKAAAEQLKNASRFAPIGSSAAQANTGASSVEEARKAAETVFSAAAGNTSREKAMAEAWTDERYAAYLAETGN